MGYTCKGPNHNKVVATPVVNEPGTQGWLDGMEQLRRSHASQKWPEIGSKELQSHIDYVRDKIRTNGDFCIDYGQFAVWQADGKLRFTTMYAVDLSNEKTAVMGKILAACVETEAEPKSATVNIGSVGQLKSGGPLMTVVGFVEVGGVDSGLAAFVWMSNGEANTADFPIESVEFISGPELAMARLDTNR